MCNGDGSLDPARGFRGNNMINRIGLSLLALFAAAALFGCGGGGSSTPAVPVSVQIIPPKVTLGIGASLPFQTKVTGSSSGVTYSVLEPNGGTITPTGVYTAPQTAGTFHVVATLSSDRSVTAIAEVDVGASAVSITISPTTATVLPGQTQTFTAAVTGVPDTGVTFSVAEPTGGTITQSGVYTAPTTPGVYHVVAASTVDPAQTATATVTVPTVQVTLNPASVTLGPNGTQPFTATVTGTSNTGVTFSVQQPNGGTINQNGVYVAPAVPGTYTVIASSAALPSATAMATVTVSANTGIGIELSPASAVVNQGAQQPFTATVTGAQNTAATFAVQEPGGGSISSTGVYTAPNTPGTYHVVATSLADTSKQATATVTVPPVALSVTVSPASAITSTSPLTATTMIGGTLMIIPTVTGSSNTAVTYAVVEGAAGGTVGADGTYTAPQVAGTYHVKVTSVADTTQSAIVTIVVTPGPQGSGSVIIQ